MPTTLILHVYDGSGYHAWYQSRGLNSGGQLYADVVDGFGPESFTIDRQAIAYPYRIDVHYYRKGPSGHGLGALQVIQHDGHGTLAVRTIPLRPHERRRPNPRVQTRRPTSRTR